MCENEVNKISGIILDSSIEVHRFLGPGLLESVYELCLCKELELRKINYKRQVLIPIIYKGEKINSEFKIDLIVENEIIVELKSVEKLHPVFTAQLLTHMKLTNKAWIAYQF